MSVYANIRVKMHNGFRRSSSLYRQKVFSTKKSLNLILLLQRQPQASNLIRFFSLAVCVASQAFMYTYTCIQSTRSLRVPWFIIILFLGLSSSNEFFPSQYRTLLHTSFSGSPSSLCAPYHCLLIAYVAPFVSAI